MSTPSARLAQLGLDLPAVPAPVGAYVPALVIGDWVFVSGQLPFRDGQLAYVGKVGAELSLEDGREAARVAALNGLAAAAGAAGGLDRLTRVVRLAVYVNAAPHFTEHAQVANGASELLGAVFDTAGRHARAAIGVATLPLNAAVEVELLFGLG